MKNIAPIWALWDNGNFLGSNRATAYVTVEKDWFLRTVTNLSGITTSWPTADRVGPWRSYQDIGGPVTITTPESITPSAQVWAPTTGGAPNLDNTFYLGFYFGADGPHIYTWGDPIGGLQAEFDAYYGVGFVTLVLVDNPGVAQSITATYVSHSYLGGLPADAAQISSWGGSIDIPSIIPPTVINGSYTPAVYSALETEIPSVKSIQIDRSLDTDAASCNIVIYNSSPPSGYADTIRDLGGYYSYNRGQSAEAVARWGANSNDWANVLVPMALIRTYEGYGGSGDRVGDISNGNVTITGTWFVDNVSVGTDGNLKLACRDAAKLLIEQMLYPPIVPQSLSPLKYYRWKDSSYNAIWDAGAGLAAPGTPPIPIKYFSSSTDAVTSNINGFGVGADVAVLGYKPSNVVDNSEANQAIGFGFVLNTDDAVDWWEVQVNAPINRVYISPWGGGYTAYISIVENSAWANPDPPAAATTIPYTPGSTSNMAPGATVGDSGAGIPYIAVSGVSFELPVTIELPRTYQAQLVRITLKDLKVGGGYTTADTLYRSGLREVAVGLSNLPSSPWSFAMARHFNNGYWVVAANGQVFPFGQATALTDNSGKGISDIIVGAEGHPTAAGFWTLERNGRVHSYGASSLQTDGSGNTDAQQIYAGTANPPSDFIDIAVTYTGNGYWLLRSTGGVYAFGDAVYASGTYNGSSTTGEIPSNPTDITKTATSIAGHPTGMGYWITDYYGKVGNFGIAANVGELTPPLPASGYPAAIEPTATGDGYWILWGNGQIFRYGDATYPSGGGQAIGGQNTASGYGGIYWDMVRSNLPATPDVVGYWALRADGFVGNFGANFFGQPGGTGTTRTDGNYIDYIDIIKDLLGWAGFVITETTFEGVFLRGINGVLESTGVYAEQALDESLFDKKPVMDAIRTIKEVVGYITYVDESGGFHFVAPNWWAPGNFYEDGTRVSFIPEIDEERQLFDYNVTFSDESLRSEIIIANQLPTADNKNVILTRYTPPGQNYLRGMQRVAIWSNEVFNRTTEQEIMAELIGMHIWFAQRQGSTTCVANPCIQLNDQVRIWERTTAESYIHYVRGISTNHDLDTGQYTMSLTTHWLGSDTSWVIQSGAANLDQNNFITISPNLTAFLANTGSQAANPNYFIGYTGG